MTLKLKTTDPDFEERFAALLAVKRETASDVNDAVAAIIAKVRAEGDSALVELTKRFDGLDLQDGGHQGQRRRDRSGAGQDRSEDACRARARA